MTPDTAGTSTWRCPVCEGVNHGGRVCSTCGERLPDGYVPPEVRRRPAAPQADRPTVVPPPRPARTPTPQEIFGSDPFR